MLLKRHYDPAGLAAWTRERDAWVAARRAQLMETLGCDADEAEQMLRRRYVDRNGVPAVRAVEPRRLPEVQKISTRLVEQGTADGWIAIGDGRITLKTPAGQSDVVYRIEHGPARYCCICGTRVEPGKERPAHMDEHADEASPDSNNPAGWRRDDFYTCALEREEVAADG